MAACTDTFASTHESFVDLLRRLPHVVVRAIEQAIGDLPDGEPRDRHPHFEVPSLVRRARKVHVDLLITIHDRTTKKILYAIVVEFQDCKDPHKYFDWPLTQVACAAEFRATAKVAVFTINPEVHAWVEAMALTQEPSPVPISARHIELIQDLGDARLRPLEAVLGAVCHARAETPLEEKVAGIRAGLVALRVLDGLEGQRYDVLMLNTVPTELAQRALRELQEEGEIDALDVSRITAFDRLGYSFNHGLEEGREEGREEGLRAGREEGLAVARRSMRRALADVLALRGLTLSATQQRRVASSCDLQQLESWYEAAKHIDIEQIDALLR